MRGRAEAAPGLTGRRDAEGGRQRPWGWGGVETGEMEPKSPRPGEWETEEWRQRGTRGQRERKGTQIEEEGTERGADGKKRDGGHRGSPEVPRKGRESRLGAATQPATCHHVCPTPIPGNCIMNLPFAQARLGGFLSLKTTKGLNVTLIPLGLFREPSAVLVPGPCAACGPHPLPIPTPSPFLPHPGVSGSCSVFILTSHWQVPPGVSEPLTMWSWGLMSSCKLGFLSFVG